MPYPEKLPLYTIWDDIAYFLESTNDLLSLALTCHTFKDLIIPDHLEYRYIYCSLRDKDLWRFLGNRPRLTRGTRFIELIEDSQDVSASLPPITNEDITLFTKALSHMTLLREFSWKQLPGSLEGLIQISDAVTSTTQCLKALCFHSPKRTSNIQPWKIEKLSLWSLTGLTKVIMNCPHPSATEMILHSCPDIEYLRLTDLTTSFTISLMQKANWKRLRYLTLSSHQDFRSLLTAAPHRTNVPIASFFDRHINIECLRLNLDRCIPPKLSSSCLPKLRSIEYKANNSHWRLTHFLSDDAIYRLVHWKTSTLNLDGLPRMDRLESFCVSTSFEPDHYALFLSKAPNLKKISLVPLNFEGEPWPYEQLIRPFLGCFNLTCIDFRGFPFIPTDETDNPLSIGRLCHGLSPLRSLTYLQVHSEQSREAICVKLRRDQNGHYIGHHFVTSKEPGGNAAYWGDLF